MPHAFGKAYASLFLPPVNRTMRVLDRSFFRKTIPLTVMDIYQRANISRVKRDCIRDVLDAPRIDPELKVEVYGKDRHLWLLKPGIKYDDPSTFSRHMKSFLQKKWMELRPYELRLEYSYWTYDEILSAILPEELGSPKRSFEPIAQLGNMILKPQFSPYRKLIAEVLLDKTPQHKTVVMKPVNMELMEEPLVTPPPLEHLAGDPNTNVELAASKCTFSFDYSRVHWDPSMTYPNKTLTNKFEENEAVADVMAGVGPVAIPAAKKRVFVFANDADTETYNALSENIIKNQVPDFCYSFNRSPREFIRTAIYTLASRSRSGDTNKVYLTLPYINLQKPPPAPRAMKLPTVFSHFIINARAGSTSLLSAFYGAYRDLQLENRIMPWIHVYVHGPNGNLKEAAKYVCKKISKGLGHEVRAADLEECILTTKGKEVGVYRVTFRLPKEVAFARISKKRKERGLRIEEKIEEKVNIGKEMTKEGGEKLG